MHAVKEPEAVAIKTSTEPSALCYHCGLPCLTNSAALNNKAFCCEGCKLVYELLQENGLCDYYKLQAHPGLSQIKPVRNDKYSFLDNEDVAKQLYKFTNGDYTIVTFYIPGVHCSSCMWLLEHLGRVNDGIIESRLNFTTKEVTIHFSRSKTTLRKVTELLTTIGYEPYISLDEANKKKTKNYNKQKIYKLGVAGFCFGNVMMMSFPEYLSHDTGIEQQYTHLFRYLNLLLAIPVFFYSGSEFFMTAWKGIKQKMLNIDAPIAIALIITFARSIYEIAGNTGSGYLDSMCGIGFFMLAGRVAQERTYKSMSFHRDYKSYFPIAVNVVTANGVQSKRLQELKEKDVVQLHHDEIIPADAIVLEGKAYIDYSFVTGESEPVTVMQNEMVYAGGKQVGTLLTIQIIKPVAGSYLTSLWNHHSFSKNKAAQNEAGSAIHILSKYFTWILLALAAGTAVYWYIADPSKILASVTAMLIVACPCALLLSATFTNGNLLRIFSNNGLFLRDATVIEQLGKIDHIVFDKTGTLTQNDKKQLYSSGHPLTEQEKDLLYSAVRHSSHPYSKALALWLGHRQAIPITEWTETTGKGLTAIVAGKKIMVGSGAFLGITKDEQKANAAAVYVRINNEVTSFQSLPVYRHAVRKVIPALASQYKLSLISGDNNHQQAMLAKLFGDKSKLLFEQAPMAKLQYIEALQQQDEKILMVGDGLNDAGALQQSNVGVTLADDINNFTPSCDAILDAENLAFLPALLQLAKASRYLIGVSFVVSVVYNIIGLSFAMQGKLKPMVAAILMPCSTLTIVIISGGVTSLVAKCLHLRLKTNTSS